MSDFEHSELENILDEAIQRVESGERLDSVLLAYPEKYRAELREMLSVVNAFEQIVAEPVPLPSASTRAISKQNFLASAKELKQAETPVVSTATESTYTESNGYVDRAVSKPNLSSSAPTQRVQKSGGQISLLQRLGAALDNIFQVPVQRLAPIAALLLLAIVSLGSFYTVAWSVPGDLAYPFKEWARRVEVDLASPEDLPAIVAAQNVERKEELEVAQGRADLNDSVLTATMRTIYRGQGMGDLILTDATNILPRFQPDANVADKYTEMARFGYLEPGVEIEVEYQIVPGGQAYVQGIQLTVVDVPPVEIPTPVYAQTPSDSNGSVSSAAALQPCNASPDVDWVSYRIRSYDTLSSIATATGASMELLASRNCIFDPNTIVAGVEIYVPSTAIVQPDLAVPNTPTTVFVPPTEVPATTLPTVEVPATVAAEPTALPAYPAPVTPDEEEIELELTTIPTLIVPENITPTVELTATIAVTGTPIIDGGPAPEAVATEILTITLPTDEITPTVTLEATPVVTATFISEPTVVVSGTNGVEAEEIEATVEPVIVTPPIDETVTPTSTPLTDPIEPTVEPSGNDNSGSGASPDAEGSDNVVGEEGSTPVIEDDSDANEGSVDGTETTSAGVVPEAPSATAESTMAANTESIQSTPTELPAVPTEPSSGE